MKQQKSNDINGTITGRIRFEKCSRCGTYNQLIWTGKIWLQPEHQCDGELLINHFFNLMPELVGM